MGRRLAVVLLLGSLASPAAALNPATDVLVPAAARAGSWVTDLYVLNPQSSAVAVTVYWLVRQQPNPSPPGFEFVLEPGATRVMEDVILNELGLERGEGAFRVVANGAVVVSSRIYSRDAGATFGQGFEGIPGASATAAGQSSDVVGLVANADFRTNLYALAGEGGAVFVVSLRDASGVEMASRVYSLGPHQPMLGNILTELGGPQFDRGSLHVEVTSGAAVVGASRVDEVSQDPTTLAGSWDCPEGGELEPAGVYYGVLETDRDRGFRMVVEGGGGVTELRFQMGSSQPGCNFSFDANGLFDPPVPLEDLLGPEGVSFSSVYPTGQIDWTVRLVESSRHLHYTGSVSGFASGSPGSPSCAGPTGTGQVHLGKQPL